MPGGHGRADSSSDPRIIVALDMSSPGDAVSLANKLEPAHCRLKVGNELFVAGGPSLVGRLIDRGYDVFLDLKFHDIPNTVAKACSAAADLGVWMINFHIAGGPAMIAAAKDATAARAHSPLLVGVTVLTSLDGAELSALGIPGEPIEWVTRWAQLAVDHRLDGVVCSAQEAGTLRERYGDALLLVTPGIRPAGSSPNDQRRAVSPGEARRLGADYLVIGRPVTAASDPYGRLLALQSEISYG